VYEIKLLMTVMSTS